MVIMRSSKEIQQGKWFSRLKEYFNVRLVIIEVRPGETSGRLLETSFS